jgi:predicted nucleotide-binding protein
MARQNQQAQPEKKLSTLQLPRAEAESRIRAQIEKGMQFSKLEIHTSQELENATADMSKWSSYNGELLRRIVDTDELYNDYRDRFAFAVSGSRFSEYVEDFQSRVNNKINRLESILGRLELIPESTFVEAPKTVPQAVSVESNKKVFVVHGHDEEAKQLIARCIERLGLEAIILHEQANRGRTIIEKFEDYANVAFAVILLTPDDVGAGKDYVNDLKPRARQNVILELGFFLGKLGRNRVCALHKGNLELPSDFSGVLWIPMDPNGAWQFSLAKEMKAVGLDLDLNVLI